MKTKDVKIKERKGYTTMIRLSKRHFEMVDILREKHNINISSLFRNTIEDVYNKLQKKW